MTFKYKWSSDGTFQVESNYRTCVVNVPTEEMAQRIVKELHIAHDCGYAAAQEDMRRAMGLKPQ